MMAPLPPPDFSRLALLHLDAIYRTACRLTGRRAEAEDLVQETFLEAHRSFPTLRDPDRCRAWLFRILRHCWFHRRQAERAAGTVALEPHRAPAGDLEAELLALGFSDEVERSLRALPEEFRTAVVLVAIEELTYEEAAVAMDCPVGTIRSRVARGRALLAAALADAPAAAARRGRSP
jgi:RNA polymerase sigma-70 factor (ECF subfamily)